MRGRTLKEGKKKCVHKRRSSGASFILSLVLSSNIKDILGNNANDAHTVSRNLSKRSIAAFSPVLSLNASCCQTVFLLSGLILMFKDLFKSGVVSSLGCYQGSAVQQLATHAKSQR